MTHERRVALGIGAAFGLVAGAIGVTQWVLTARDLAARDAAFRAMTLPSTP